MDAVKKFTEPQKFQEEEDDFPLNPAWAQGLPPGFTIDPIDRLAKAKVALSGADMGGYPVRR